MEEGYRKGSADITYARDNYWVTIYDNGEPAGISFSFSPYRICITSGPP
jgi:hypothetical protein